MCRFASFFFLVGSAIACCPASGNSQEPPPPGPQVDAPTPPVSTTRQLHFQLMRVVEQLEPFRPADTVEGEVLWHGEVTMQDLGQRWVRNFKQFHPGVQFQGVVSNSNDSLQAFAENPKIIAGITRQVDESDLKALQSGNCKEPVALVVGIEAMALFVHQSNPIATVSKETAQRVYGATSDGSPNAKRWGDLGVQGSLASAPIATYGREPANGTQVFLSRSILGGASVAKPTTTCSSNMEVCESIAKDPKGIGIADMNYNVTGVRRVPLLVDGNVIEATEENLLTGRYPLVRPLLLIFDKSQVATDGKLRESIARYVLSREGQTRVMASGFYPIDPGFAAEQLAQIFGQQIR